SVAVQVEPAFAPAVRLAHAHFLRQVHALESGELARGLDRRVDVDGVAGDQRPVLRAAVAQQARELARVDTADGDHATLAQPVRQRDLVAPARGPARHVAHDQAGSPRLARLVVGGVAAGVADVR